MKLWRLSLFDSFSELLRSWDAHMAKLKALIEALKRENPDIIRCRSKSRTLTPEQGHGRVRSSPKPKPSGSSKRGHSPKAASTTSKALAVGESSLSSNICCCKLIYRKLLFLKICGGFPFSHLCLFGPGESETEASVGDEGERGAEEETSTDDECVSALAWK